MTKLSILFLVAQALLIQNVFSACLGGPSVNVGSIGIGPNCGYGASLNNAILGPVGPNIGVLNSGYGGYSGYNGPSVNLGGIGIGPNCGYGPSLNNAFLGPVGPNIGVLNSVYDGYPGYGGYFGYGNSGYGGTGTGQITANGELDVGGYSNVYGNLPTSGLVQFNGNLPAAGYITVIGNTPSICDCGCNYY